MSRVPLALATICWCLALVSVPLRLDAQPAPRTVRVTLAVPTPQPPVRLAVDGGDFVRARPDGSFSLTLSSDRCTIVAAVQGGDHVGFAILTEREFRAGTATISPLSTALTLLAVVLGGMPPDADRAARVVVRLEQAPEVAALAEAVAATLRTTGTLRAEEEFAPAISRAIHAAEPAYSAAVFAVRPMPWR